MFRVRNWTGEEINCGTTEGAREGESERGREKHPGECDPLLRGDVSRVYTPRRHFRAAAALHLTPGRRKKKRAPDKTRTEGAANT